jgi:hypothetical protein
MSFWYSTLLLETSTLIEDKALAQVFLDMFRSEQRRFAKPLAVLVPRQTGKAANLLGRFDESRNLLEKALEVCQQIDYLPELALTRLDLAELLIRQFPNERPRALQLLDLTLVALEEMGMLPALERALALRNATRAT